MAAENSTKALLLPFDNATQAKLKRVDLAMRAEKEVIEEKLKKASLMGYDYNLSQQDLVSVTVMEAYGILYNRAVEAGWIQDIHLEE